MRFLLLPAGARGPAFLMLQNFRVIMKYNPAEAYALAIGHLADRLRGGGPFVQSWPRDERALSMAERFELQQLLARRGFDIGEPDGLLGPRTRIAIRNFQVAAGQFPTDLPRAWCSTGCGNLRSTARRPRRSQGGKARQ